jgi:hypothetical protein
LTTLQGMEGSSMIFFLTQVNHLLLKVFMHCGDTKPRDRKVF